MKSLIGLGLVFLVITFIRACKPSKKAKDNNKLQQTKSHTTTDQQSIDAINAVSRYIEYFRKLDTGRQQQELVKTQRANFASPMLQEMFLQSMEDVLLNQERSSEEDAELKQMLDQIDEFKTFSPQEQAYVINEFKKKYDLNDPFYYGTLKNFEVIVRETDNERYNN